MRYNRYPSYRDSGVEWIDEIPKHWDISKFKYEIYFQEGPGILGKDFKDQGIPLIRISNLSNKIVSNVFKQYLDPIMVKEKWNHFRVMKDDLLISASATTGIISEVSLDTVGSIPYTGIIKLKPNNKDMTRRYIKWFILSNAFLVQIDQLKTGTAMQHFGPYHLNMMGTIKLPLQEQQTIANYLDKATVKIDTLIEKQTKLIELLKEKRQAVISTAVTRGLDDSVAMKDSGGKWLGEIPEHWEVWKISHAFRTIGSGTTPSTTKQSYYEGTTPWITTGELRENTILQTKKNLSDEALRDFSSLKQFPVGSIAIAMYGATIGRLGVLGIKATTNQACCVMTDSISIKNEYLFYWLMGYRDEIIKLGYGGGQPNISRDTISNLQVSAPSIELQEVIINYLDDKTSKIDSLIIKSTKAIDLLKEKRTTLISSAVSGKIDVSKEGL